MNKKKWIFLLWRFWAIDWGREKKSKNTKQIKTETDFQRDNKQITFCALTCLFVVVVLITGMKNISNITISWGKKKPSVSV